MSKKIIIFAVIAVIVAGAGFWYWQTQKSKVPESIPVQSTASDATTTLGGRLFEKTGNPVQNVPETNPFGKVKINPFKSIYTNPFK